METKMLDITKFGAVGDGAALNTESIQAAIDAAAKTGETVCVPGGVFLTGTLNLHGVSLHLEAGAVLKPPKISRIIRRRTTCTTSSACCAR